MGSGFFDDPVAAELLHVEIKSRMLFSDDESMRRQFYNAAIVALARDNPDSLPSDPSSLKELFLIAASSPSLESFQGEMRVRSERGFLCGYVLHEALGRRCFDFSEASIEGIVNEVVKQDRKRAFGRISKKTFDNSVWPQFKPVAHYWAAAVTHVQRDGEPCPCALGKLKAFLGLAEAFRLAGETTRTARSPIELLSAVKTLKLPAGLALPPLALDFDPVEAVEK
jgi:hypothetical protein